MIADEMKRALAAMKDGHKDGTLSKMQFFAGIAVLEDCADRVAEMESKPVPAPLRVTDGDLRSGKVLTMLQRFPAARPRSKPE